MAEVGIKDGGSGSIAKVDANKRLHVLALTNSAVQDAHLTNSAYDISTGGLINIQGSGTTNALLYIQNIGDPDLIVDTIFIDSTSAAAVPTIAGNLHWHLNPTGGTIVSDAVVAQTLNRRIGSPVDLSHIAFKASGEGKTFSGGDKIDFPFGTGLGVAFTRPFVIPKGQTFGIMYVSPVGNTSPGFNMQAGVLLIIDSTQAQ